MYPRRLGGNALLQFAMEVGLTPPIILVPQDSIKRMSGYLKKSAKPLKLSNGPVTQEACFGVKSRELTPRI